MFRFREIREEGYKKLEVSLLKFLDIMVIEGYERFYLEGDF